MTRLPAAVLAILACAPVLAQEPALVTEEDIFSRAEELEGRRVMVQDGRIFAAADRSAGLKIGAVFLPLRLQTKGAGIVRRAWSGKSDQR